MTDWVIVSGRLFCCFVTRYRYAFLLNFNMREWINLVLTYMRCYAMLWSVCTWAILVVWGSLISAQALLQRSYAAPALLGPSPLSAAWGHGVLHAGVFTCCMLIVWWVWVDTWDHETVSRCIGCVWSVFLCFTDLYLYSCLVFLTISYFSLISLEQLLPLAMLPF